MWEFASSTITARLRNQRSSTAVPAVAREGGPKHLISLYEGTACDAGVNGDRQVGVKYRYRLVETGGDAELFGVGWIAALSHWLPVC
jgi:hypothetical protein